MTSLVRFKLNRCVFLTSLCVSFLYVSSEVTANQTLLYGEWGTDAQCSRSLITPNGTKYHAPFKITAEWLQHGDSWCRLQWVDVIENDIGAYAVAEALCGEDDSRNYRINFSLYNGELTLLWSDAFENSGLMRCLK